MPGLAVLLQLAGLIFTFSFGTAGYVIGPLTLIAGGWLYRHEQRRRKELAANPPVVAPVSPPASAGMAAFPHWSWARSSSRLRVYLRWCGA